MRLVMYSIVFLLGGLTALTFNSSLFSRKVSPQPVKQAVMVSEEETVNVGRVIDGDTIELDDKRKIRYIGMDTPEVGDNRKQVECFAKEAMEENRRLVEGKTVRLEKDISEMDKYGRLLRYVYVGSPADEFVNDSLVRQGFARIDTVPPDVVHRELFLASQREAREQGRGLWGGCPSKSNTSGSSNTSNSSNGTNPTNSTNEDTG